MGVDQKSEFVSFLQERGYRLGEMEFGKKLVIPTRDKFEVLRPDLVVKAEGYPVFVVLSKEAGKFLSVRKAYPYAHLLDKPASYLVLVKKGLDFEVFDSLTGRRVEILPSRGEWLRISKERIWELTAKAEELRRRAKRELWKERDIQEISSVLERCHDIIRDYEKLDPTVAFDEIVKLLFMRIYERNRIEEARRLGEEVENRFTLEEVRRHRIRGRDLLAELFEEAKRKSLGVFEEDEKIGLERNTVEDLVKELEHPAINEGFDVKGVAFETFLKEVFRGPLGQFFTPREIVEFMVELVEPRKYERILDPAVGSGGFLIKSFEKIEEEVIQSEDLETRDETIQKIAENQILGIDANPRIARVCKMNMIMHGITQGGIFKYDSLRDLSEMGIQEGTFNLILTNPPFGMKERNQGILENYDLGKTRGGIRNSQNSEILFLEKCLKLLQPGGRLAIVLPDGVLTNTSLKYVRDYIKEKAIIRAVTSLPHETFVPYGSGVKASVLYVQKKDENLKQGRIFMVIAENVGYDATGRATGKNELPYIADKYNEL